MHVSFRVAAASSIAVLLSTGLATGSVHAALPHDNPVSTNAADFTPQVVATQSVPKPYVDAITAEGATTYAGGRFDRVAKGTASVARSNIVAFSTTDGTIRPGFSPVLDGQVRALENAADGGVYVGGDFKNVNGTRRGGLVKLTAAGAIDTTFKPPFAGGIVHDVELVNGHLVVGGAAGRKLMSLNPTTGADDGWISQSITGRVCLATGECSWGTTAVYDFAVENNRLVAVGNFTEVNGQPRSKFFMLNLGASSSLNPWYYQSFRKPCATNATRRIANLQGVDWDPTGQYFNVAATGQIPEYRSEIWHEGDGAQSDSTVCDALGRFAYSDASKAVWINYTGGDSMWRVADTGSTVYVQGHFQWVDNPDGFASQCPAGDNCSRRSGIAAINPTTGRAYADWHPAVPTSKGGKAFEVTPDGLWVGSNSPRFGGENHYGIAFAPTR